MKAISDKTMDTFEEVALEGAKKIKEFLAYEGNNPSYYQKAKAGSAAISGYSRIRASESNREAIELARNRIDSKLLAGVE